MAGSLSSYKKALKKLFPRGSGWHALEGGLLGSLVEAIANEFKRIDDKIKQVIKFEIYPFTTNELLEDFEKDFALPDECTSVDQTVNERRQQLIAKITNRGGLHSGVYSTIGENLGYELETVRYQNFKVGRSQVGQRLYTDAWRFYWAVKAPATNARTFKVGESKVGEQLVSFSNETLECMIKKYKPAFTEVHFIYED